MRKKIQCISAIPIILLFCFATLTLAAEGDGRDGKVQWKELGKLQLTSKPVMMVPSLDGKLIYILTHESNVLVYDNRGELQGKVPVDEGVSSIDISPKGELLYLMDDNRKLLSFLSISLIVDIQTEGAPIKGNVDAPVTIAVYADFE